MIAVDQLVVAPKVDQLRAQLGNDIAIKAFKEGTIPFPDGSHDCRDSLDSCLVGIQQ